MALLYRIWEHDVGRPINIALSPDAIISQEPGRRLVRFDPISGIPRWETAVAYNWGQIALSPSYVGYSMWGELVQCFDAHSGEALWTRTFPSTKFPRDTRQIVLRGERFAVCMHSGTDIRLDVLESASGQTLWTVQRKHGNCSTRFINTADGFAICTHTGVTFVTADGEIVREIALPGQVPLPFDTLSLQQRGSSLLYLTPDGGIYTIKPASDATWQHIGDLGMPVSPLPPVIHGQLLFFRRPSTAEDLICCYDLAAAAMRWQVRAQWYGGATAALLVGGRVVTQTGRGHLVVVNPQGEIIGKKAVRKRVTTPIVALPNDMIIFGTKGTIAGYQVTM